MRRTAFHAALLCLLVAIGCGGCGPPQASEKNVIGNAKEFSPGDVDKAWNDALTKGDVKSAADRTSSTSSEYTKQKFLYLEQLSVTYQKGMKDLKVETKIVHEEISGDTAIVVYRVQYGDKTVKYWMDKLFREAGDWKVAPQFVQTLTLKE